MVTPDLVEDDAPDAALDETIEHLEAQSVDETPPVPSETGEREPTTHRVSSEISESNGEGPEPSRPAANEDDEPEIAEVELSDEDFADDDLFSGIEESSDEDEKSENDGDGGSRDTVFDPETPGESLQETINDGASRLAVVGLDDNDEKDDLQGEMRDVFEAFRLGTYGSLFAEEYLFVDENEVDPAWALLGSAIACAGVALLMRPDSGEQVAKMQSAINGLGGSSSRRRSRRKSGVLT